MVYACNTPIFLDHQNIENEDNGLKNPTLALNLSPVRDFSPGVQFLDIMKMARPWVGHTEGNWGSTKFHELLENEYIDENGWIVEIPEGLQEIATIWAWNGLDEETQSSLSGTYILEYEGEGTLELSGDAKILSETDGRITFENGGGTFELTISETDPNKDGNYIRNISVVKEENIALYEAGATFNPEWISLVQDVRELRFMDWMETNNSTVTSWQEMPKANHGPSHNVALEDMVKLANEVGADVWFTMPHLASDEYIYNFATYVRDNLDPNLKVKVEYSNEAWNYSFAQTKWLHEQANNEWGEGNAYDFYIKKATETALIWEEVFGQDPEGRLINVLGTQTSNPWVSNRIIEAELWQKHEPESFVDPKTVFEDLAITNYFGSSVVRNEELRDELISAIQDPNINEVEFLYQSLLDANYPSSIPQVTQQALNQAAIAEQAGLGLIAYEGGQHVHHSFAVRDLSDEDREILNEFLAEFVRSPEMASLYEVSWEAWSSVSTGPYMQFGEISASSQWGSWGLLEGLSDSTPRATTLFDLNASELPWWAATGGQQYQQGYYETGSELNDQLIGTDHEDYLLSGGGDDMLVGGLGNDGLNGGIGNDTAIFSGEITEYHLVREGEGYSIIGPDGHDFLINVEKLQFEDMIVCDLPTLTEGPNGNLLYSVFPEVEIDTIDLASIGVDGIVVYAINGNSTLGKILGNNGQQENTYFAMELGATASIGSSVVSGNYWSIHENRNSKFGEEISNDPFETINALGSLFEGVNELILGEGNDKFFGRGANDIVYGAAGRDIILGRSGEDILNGGAGNDYLVGGKGDDILIGGAGSDRFVFHNDSGNDIITDFEANDVIDLRGFLGDGMALQDAISYANGSMVISNGASNIVVENVFESDLWVIDQILVF